MRKKAIVSIIKMKVLRVFSLIGTKQVLTEYFPPINSNTENSIGFFVNEFLPKEFVNRKFLMKTKAALKHLFNVGIYNLDIFPEDIRRADEGLMVLGTPIGCPDFVKLNVSNTTTKEIDLMIRAKEIQDPQMELLLLRCCTGSPKIAYWSRTCNPSIITSELDTFDRGMDAALQHNIGVPISGIDRDLAHLPLSFGGLGIPRVSLVADFIFVSSIGSSWKLQPQSTPRLGYIECAGRITQNISSIPALPIKNLIVSPPFTPLKEFNQRMRTIKFN